jgi:hypothetical protein
VGVDATRAIAPDSGLIPAQTSVWGTLNRHRPSSRTTSMHAPSPRQLVKRNQHARSIARLLRRQRSCVRAGAARSFPVHSTAEALSGAAKVGLPIGSIVRGVSPFGFLRFSRWIPTFKSLRNPLPIVVPAGLPSLLHINPMGTSLSQYSHTCGAQPSRPTTTIFRSLTHTSCPERRTLFSLDTLTLSCFQYVLLSSCGGAYLAPCSIALT